MSALDSIRRRVSPFWVLQIGGWAAYGLLIIITLAPTLHPGVPLSRLVTARDDDGSRMTDRQLRDEAMTLYLAGHETTALTLSWSWVLLARHPRVEEKLVAEWKRVLDGRTPTPDDLPNLPYTDAVITEAMRVYPPVYLIGREATCDLELAFQPERGDGGVGLVEEVVVVPEIRQHLRMDDQRGVGGVRVGRGQVRQLRDEFVQQCIGRGRLAEHEAHLLLDVHRLGERAQVQPDHRALQPATGRGDGIVPRHRISRGSC